MASVATNFQEPTAHLHKSVLIRFSPSIMLLLCECESPTCPGGTFAFCQNHVPRNPLNPPFMQLEALPADYVCFLFDGMKLPGGDVLEIYPAALQ